MASTSPNHLEPSELGSKQYWDNYYSADLSSPPSSTASLDGWFEEVGAGEKILDYLSDPTLGLDHGSCTFLDLGTGNGQMLFMLRKDGEFKGRMLGVDYSLPSIELARKIQAAKALHHEGLLDFDHWDIIHDEPPSSWNGGFDVVLDKGTFDAISLSDERDEHGRRICEGYAVKIRPLIKDGGFLLVTSCNWTERELRNWFERDAQFKMVDRISYPSFTFGGQTGQSISTLCFAKSGGT